MSGSERRPTSASGCQCEVSVQVPSTRAYDPSHFFRISECQGMFSQVFYGVYLVFTDFLVFLFFFRDIFSPKFFRRLLFSLDLQQFYYAGLMSKER